MKLKTITLISSILAITAASSSMASTRTAIPDLVITSAGLQLERRCNSSKPLIKAYARVKNIGNGSSPQRNTGMVLALDTHNNRWGNSTGLKNLQPGQSAVVTFFIYSRAINQRHLPGTHRFKFRLNTNKWFTESNYTNNVRYVSVRIPRGYCRSLQRRNRNMIQPAPVPRKN